MVEEDSNMAMFAPIPMPDREQTFKDVMDALAQMQQRRQQQQQFSQQFGLQQQAAQRAQELQPLTMRELEASAQLKTAQAAKAKQIMNALSEINSPSAGTSNPSSITNNNVSSGNVDKKQKLKDFLYQIGAIKPTPSEETEQKIQVAKGEANIKLDEAKKKELIDAGELVNQYAPNWKTIYSILNKDNNTTGNIAGLRNMLHLGTEDQGAFNAAATPLLGKLAKDISQRGGAVVANLASTGKPGIWHSHATNMGLTKENIRESISSYNKAKNNYEEKFGEKYPVKLDSFLANYKDDLQKVLVISPDGKRIRFPADKVDQFLKDHPDHKRIS